MLDDYGVEGSVAPDTFTLVQYHLDAYGTAWSNARAGFYGAGGTPDAWFDGTTEASGSTTSVSGDRSRYEGIYNSHLGQTDVTISVYGVPLGGQTYRVQAQVCLEAGGVAKTVRVQTVQVLDYWPASPSYHRNGFKQAAAYEDVTLVPGQCSTVLSDFTFDTDSWNAQDDIKIIAWAQDLGGSPPANIHQTAVMTWPFPTGDCNSNGVEDYKDISLGTSTDCNLNSLPDECELDGNDCDGNLVHDACDSAALITDQTDDVIGCPGEASYFSVTAPGATSYQWYKNGSLLSDGGDVTGATTDELVIANVGAPDEGSYHCLVEDGCIAADSDSAVLTMVVPASITTEPVSVITTCAGNTAVFTVEAEGSGLTYLWSKDGDPLSDDGRITGSTSATLLIDNVGAFDPGTYTCHVEDYCGGWEETSGSSLQVDVAFTLQPVDTCVEPGDTAILYADTLTMPPQAVSYFWQKDGAYLADGGGISGAYTDTLSISGVDAGDAGEYKVTVLTNNCMIESVEGTLQIGGCDLCPTPGDMDSDADYDLADMQEFTICFGADVTVETDCACANVDSANNVVDLDDWAAFVVLLGGPM